MKARIFGVPVPFEVLASPLKGDVAVTIRVAGNEHRLTLDPLTAQAVASALEDASRKAAHHG